MRRLTFFALAALSLSLSLPAQAQWKKTDPSATDSFVFVPSDKLLKQSGMTREEWNAKNPRSEAEWRKAWAAKGTSGDNGFYRNLRRDTSPPAAAPKNKVPG